MPILFPPYVIPRKNWSQISTCNRTTIYGEDNTRKENAIAEMTSIVQHCTTTKDCYKIFRDRTVECVLPRNHKALDQANNSLGRCERKGCERNNDNCYHGELCIKDRCVPVSEVRTLKIWGGLVDIHSFRNIFPTTITCITCQTKYISINSAIRPKMQFKAWMPRWF